MEVSLGAEIKVNQLTALVGTLMIRHIAAWDATDGNMCDWLVLAQSNWNSNCLLVHMTGKHKISPCISFFFLQSWLTLLDLRCTKQKPPHSWTGLDWWFPWAKNRPFYFRITRINKYCGWTVPSGIGLIVLLNISCWCISQYKNSHPDGSPAAFVCTISVVHRGWGGVRGHEVSMNGTAL